MDLKKVYDSGKWVVLYNILNVFDVPMKLVGITNMCLNQTCGRVQVDEHMFDVFPTNPPIPTVKLMLEFWSFYVVFVYDYHVCECIMFF